MKKHAFKRITAIVLVFVMCVFLMPTNSLGVKAVTADDVLVEESRVSSEIGAENPASEVEVITSEEADLPVEELTSDEVVGEDADTTEEVSEETEDIEPLDVLSENGTILLADEATEEWSLSYGDTTETYASFAEVSARIDELNNAEGVYTITCKTATEGDYARFNGSFPTIAKELIFKPIEPSMYSWYYANATLETDIKITLEETLLLYGNDKIKELVVDNGSALYTEVGTYIDNLTMLDYSVMVIASPIEIKTCNIDETCELEVSWVHRFNPELGDYAYTGNGLYDINTLNLLGTTFKFDINDTQKVYSDGDVVLTTSSVITDANITQDENRSFQGKVVNNNDGTYSIVLEADDVMCYSLTYGSTVEEYKTYDEVVARIEERNSTSTTYTIQMTEDGYAKQGWMDTVYSLPTKAKKVILQAPNVDDYWLSIRLENIDKGCPIELKGWRTASVDNCILDNVICLDAGCGVSFYEGCVIDNLKLSSQAVPYVYGNISIGTLTFECEDAFGWPTIDLRSGKEYDSNGNEFYTYGAVKINKLELSSNIQGMDVDVNYSERISTPILECVNCTNTVWNKVYVYAREAESGYMVNKSTNASGSRILEWCEDTITKIELTYGGTTETFNAFDQVMARIAEINNADNDYTIDVIAYQNGITNPEIKDFPAAKSLTFVNTAQLHDIIFVRETDGIIEYPVVFDGFYLDISCEDREELDTYVLSTKDFTIRNVDYFWIPCNLNCDGTLYLEGTSNPNFGGKITVDTLKWNPGKGSGSCFLFSSEGTGGKIIADHLDLAEGYRISLSYERFDEDLDYMVINNYSEDCDRVDIKDFNYTDDAGNVYEAVMKVNDSNVCTYSRQIQQPYYYVTDSDGNTLINSRSWIDVQKAFELSGDRTKTYTIEVANGKTIGTLPTNAASINIVGDDSVANPVIKVSVSKGTLETKVPLNIANAKLEYGANGAPVNIKMTSKALVLSNATNVGTITGNSGALGIYGSVEVNKINKLNELYVDSEATLTVIDNMTNITTLGLKGEVRAWRDISVTNIITDGIGELHYNLAMKLTIAGNISFYEETEAEDQVVKLIPYANGPLATSHEADSIIIDECKLADVSDFRVNGLADTQVLYRSGNAVKVGTPVITVFENIDDWRAADASEGTQFATINDAIVYVNEETEGTFVIRLEQDVATTETLKTIQGTTDKTVLITPAGDDMVTLTFKGTFIVDGTNVEVMNVDLRNSAKANASVTLKNGANVTLGGTAVNALTVPAGTSVYIGNIVNADVDVVINGTAKCAGEVIMADNAVLWCKGALTAGNFSLDGEFAEVRILTGKAFTINGNVNIGEDSLVCINRVDKNGNLATIKAGTAMVTATNATAGQFCTQNIMTGTEDVSWLLTKSGKAIKTAGLVAYVYVAGERGEFNPQFASFNEAKEYVAAQTDGKEYVIELLSDSKGADLIDLPENLVAIVKSESATATSVKLTTSLDVTLSTNLVLDGVNLSAAKKTIYANDYELYVDNNGGITAARAKELNTIIISGGTVTFTAKDSTINYVEMGVDGTFKCPQFTGYAMG